MKNRTLNKLMLVISAVLVLSFAVASFASDVTMAPMIMPNFPMLAGDNVMLMWVPVPGAVKYKIFMNGKEIGEAPVPPFTTPKPPEPGIYKYTISGVDGSDEEGPMSREGKLSIITLEQPKDFNWRFLGEVLNIRWTNAPNAVIYDIYRADSQDGPYKLIASIAEDRYVDGGIKEEENYGNSFFYKVVSKDRFNETSSDTEVHEVKIVKPAVADSRTVVPDYTLKVRRSKQVFLAKPMGGGTNLRSSIDSEFLTDRETMVNLDGTRGKIVFLDRFGDEIRTIGSMGPKPSQYKMPVAIGIDEDDNIYITDALKQQILALDVNGNHLYSAKTHPVVEKEVLERYNLSEPFAGTRYSDVLPIGDKLYIVEKETGTIHMFDKSDGAFIDYFRDSETNEVNLVPGPTLLFFDEATDKLYVASPIPRIVTVFDIKTGKKLYNVGLSKSFIGGFLGVTGMAKDVEGNIVITDSGMHTTQVFSPENGQYLYHLGGTKAIPDPASKFQRPSIRNFNFPTNVNLDSKGRLWIYIGALKGYSVREWLSDDIWDYATDKPEGKVGSAK